MGTPRRSTRVPLKMAWPPGWRGGGKAENGSCIRGTKTQRLFVPLHSRLFVPSPFTLFRAVLRPAPEHVAQRHFDLPCTSTSGPPWPGTPVRRARGGRDVASRTFCPSHLGSRSSPLPPSTATAHRPPLPHADDTPSSICRRGARGLRCCVKALCDMARNHLPRFLESVPSLTESEGSPGEESARPALFSAQTGTPWSALSAPASAGSAASCGGRRGGGVLRIEK